MGAITITATADTYGNVDLTTLGGADYALWTDSLTKNQSKAGGGGLISDASFIGGASSLESLGNSTTFSGTDGTPTSVFSSNNSIYVSGDVPAGFSFTVPAGTGKRTLKLYAGTRDGSGRYRFTLSDGSASPVTQDFAYGGGGDGYNYVEVEFNAGSAGQTLLVECYRSNNGGRGFLKAAHISDEESGGGLSIALTGQSNTLAAGSIKASLNKSLTSQSESTGHGNLVAGLIKSLLGSSSSRSAGSLASSRTLTLTGSTETETQGTVTPSSAINVQLTGQAETISAGSVSVSLSKQLTGNSYTYSQGSVTPSTGVMVQLTGQQYSIAQGALASNRTLQITGSNETLAQGNLIANFSKSLTTQNIIYASGNMQTSRFVVLSGNAETYLQGVLTVFGLVRRQYPLAGINSDYPLQGIERDYPL